MQRQLSSFDIYVIVSELQDLIGNNIDKIYQLTRDEFLIKVKNIETKQKKSIYIRNSDFISLTQKAGEVFGEKLTKAVFDFLACSRNGLREKDLEQLLLRIFLGPLQLKL